MPASSVLSEAWDSITAPLLLQDLMCQVRQVNLQTIYGWCGGAGAKSRQQQVSVDERDADTTAERYSAGSRGSILYSTCDAGQAVY